MGAETQPFRVVTEYSRTAVMRINWGGEASGYADNPDNWILFENRLIWQLEAKKKLFCVLCLCECECVLYYWHRVSTQFQLTNTVYLPNPSSSVPVPNAVRLKSQYIRHHRVSAGLVLGTECRGSGS